MNEYYIYIYATGEKRFIFGYNISDACRRETEALDPQDFKVIDVVYAD